jgi:uncharacterized protein
MPAFPTDFLAHFSYAYAIAGLAVGFIVGMTGVGGGSLMTPILLHFGIAPVNAIGTDLLYAAVTKANGVFVHQKKRNVDWTPAAASPRRSRPWRP